MRPHVIAAALLLVVLFVIAQCVVIGGMAFESSQTHGELEKAQSDLVDVRAELGTTKSKLASAEAELANAPSSPPDEFYNGMFTLCMQAYDGSGYPAKEVVEACNKYVGEQRELKAHTRPAEGYTP